MQLIPIQNSMRFLLCRAAAILFLDFFLRVPSRTLITFTSFVAGYLIRISLFTAIRIGRTNQRKLPH